MAPVERWTAELILDAQAELGESPVWDAERRLLLWVDIPAGVVHELDPRTGEDHASRIGQLVGAVAPRRSGGLVLAIADGFAILEHSSGPRMLAPVELERNDHRMNDGSCDSGGRFWAGTMHVDFAPGEGSLYRLEPDGRVVRLLEGVTISNGIGWSPDDTLMYYVDSPTQRIDAFDFDAETGAIANRRPVVRIPEEEGMPDGLAVDVDGYIWVALWNGWCVRRYSPTGELAGIVEVPVARVTSCAFGGARLNELYITTARADSPVGVRIQQEASPGGIFRARPGISGLPSVPFAG
jgi:sugar lactone lactonase YvrE